MVSDDKQEKLNLLREQIAASLNAEYGPMIGGKNLCKVLGYNSSGAFRQALYKKTVPVEVFAIENRRGKFALSVDIAHWLAEQKFKNYE
ncbi:hypothetical protein [Alteromonas stellipolaris]|uniref:hypothetical protein n=1 Tax=Alteromonas stellipolaris TaxID=233316 RepID=UPI000B17E5BA|nr:hypothetical protein [Alteromonas stellipolaris]